jgi:hypothetical protein
MFGFNPMSGYTSVRTRSLWLDGHKRSGCKSAIRHRRCSKCSHGAINIAVGLLSQGLGSFANMLAAPTPNVHEYATL